MKPFNSKLFKSYISKFTHDDRVEMTAILNQMIYKHSEDHSGWYLIDIKGTKTGGTYPYAISYLTDEEYRSLDDKFYSRYDIVTDLPIDEAPNHNVYHKGREIKCENYPEEKARFVACVLYNYPISQVNCSVCFSDYE